MKDLPSAARVWLPMAYGLAVFFDDVGDFARGCHFDGECGAGGDGGAGDGEIGAVGFAFDGFFVAGDVPVEDAVGLCGDDEGVRGGDGDFGGAPFSGETGGSGDAGVGGAVVEFGAVGFGAGVGDAKGLAVG